MSESEDVLVILKELVGRIKELESAVYHKDNLLMKAGLVTVNTPIPVTHHNDVINSDTIHKMSWDDIERVVNGRK